MRNILATLFLLISAAIFAAPSVLSQSYTIESVPNVYVRDARQHVSDPDGILSTMARDSINSMFTALEAKTGIQAMVVMLPSIGENTPFDFAQELFRYWGIGEKNRNNGLLILYVADQRKIRFHTGYGLEGFLTDAKCKRIQSRYMVPSFRQNDVDGGMVLGAKAVTQLLYGSMKRQNGQGEERNPYIGLLALVVIIAIGGYFIWHGDRVHRTCKACKRPASLKLMSKDYYYDDHHCKHEKEVFICEHCGQIEVRDHIIERNGGGNSGSFLSGMIIGSMLGGMRGGGGGGGFSGGSFGGGSSGGGGSESSW